jgi:hypothetical protein
MREIVEKLALELGHSLHERDVTQDPELERRYVLEIPVLLMDGREIARHRITAAELRARLTRSA